MSKSATEIFQAAADELAAEQNAACEAANARVKECERLVCEAAKQLAFHMRKENRALFRKDIPVDRKRLVNCAVMLDRAVRLSYEASEARWATREEK